MKKQILKISLLIFAAATLFTSCKKADMNSLPTSAILTSGTWSITSFQQSTNDRTSNFSGLHFTFSTDGSVTARNSAGSTIGTWGNDDSHNEFHMSLSNSGPLKDLSKGWKISSRSGTEIELEDENEVEHESLHIEKD